MHITQESGSLGRVKVVVSAGWPLFRDGRQEGAHCYTSQKTTTWRKKRYYQQYEKQTVFRLSVTYATAMPLYSPEPNTIVRSALH